MSRKLGSISALVLCAAALATTATGAASKVIARKSRSGLYAAVGAHATVRHPHAFALKVFANPRQLVNGNWLVFCKRGRVRGTKVGRMNGRTPIQKKVPVALDKATSCTLSAEAVLTKKGKVTLVLYAY